LNGSIELGHGLDPFPQWVWNILEAELEGSDHRLVFTWRPGLWERGHLAARLSRRAGIAHLPPGISHPGEAVVLLAGGLQIRIPQGREAILNQPRPGARTPQPGQGLPAPVAGRNVRTLDTPGHEEVRVRPAPAPAHRGVRGHPPRERVQDGVERVEVVTLGGKLGAGRVSEDGARDAGRDGGQDSWTWPHASVAWRAWPGRTRAA